MSPAVTERSVDAERRAVYTLRFGPRAFLAMRMRREGIGRLTEAIRSDPRNGALTWRIESELAIRSTVWHTETGNALARTVILDVMDDYHEGRLDLHAREA